MVWYVRLLWPGYVSDIWSSSDSLNRRLMTPQQHTFVAFFVAILCIESPLYSLISFVFNFFFFLAAPQGMWWILECVNLSSTTRGGTHGPRLEAWLTLLFLKLFLQNSAQAMSHPWPFRLSKMPSVSLFFCFKYSSRKLFVFFYTVAGVGVSTSNSLEN